jgi:hypothetical protein
MDQVRRKVTKAGGVAAQAASVAVGMLAERMARGLVGAFKDSIDAANKLDAGLIGLSAVANAFHVRTPARRRTRRSSWRRTA